MKIRTLSLIAAACLLATNAAFCSIASAQAPPATAPATSPATATPVPADQLANRCAPDRQTRRAETRPPGPAGAVDPVELAFPAGSRSRNFPRPTCRTSS